MRTIPLDEYGTGTAGDDGTCTVTLGPTALQAWKITNVGVQSTSIDASTAKLYIGPATPQGYVSGTYDGNNDSASVAIELRTGQSITVVWEGATPGAVCTVSVLGTMRVPG